MIIFWQTTWYMVYHPSFVCIIVMKQQGRCQVLLNSVPGVFVFIVFYLIVAVLLLSFHILPPLKPLLVYWISPTINNLPLPYQRWLPQNRLNCFSHWSRFTVSAWVMDFVHVHLLLLRTDVCSHSYQRIGQWLSMTWLGFTTRFMIASYPSVYQHMVYLASCSIQMHDWRKLCYISITSIYGEHWFLFVHSFVHMMCYVCYWLISVSIFLVDIDISWSKQCNA